MPLPTVTVPATLEPLLHRLYVSMFEGEPPPLLDLLDLLDELWIEQGLRWLGLWTDDAEEAD
jgi:hypothetical protein